MSWLDELVYGYRQIWDETDEVPPQNTLRFRDPIRVTNDQDNLRTNVRVLEVSDEGAGLVPQATAPNQLLITDENTVVEWSSFLPNGVGTTVLARASTTAALPANTRSSNTLTADANGALASQDGVSLAVGDYLLVKDESAGEDNGVYVIDTLGDGSNPWEMTRVPEADTDEDARPGMLVGVAAGSANAGIWQLTTDADITLNTTALTFTKRAPTASAGGDDILVNSVACTDGNFNDSTPAAAGGGTNVTWQRAAASPDNISAYVIAATTSAKGVAEIATQAEVDAGSDTTRYVTPDTLSNYSGLSTAAEWTVSCGNAMSGNVVMTDTNNSVHGYILDDHHDLTLPAPANWRHKVKLVKNEGPSGGVGNYVLTVKNSAGTVVERLAPGEMGAYTVGDSPSTVTHFFSPKNKWFVTSIDNTDSPYTAAIGEYIRVDASSGAVTINAPAIDAFDVGGTVTIKIVGTGNAVTWVGDGGDTIESGVVQDAADTRKNTVSYTVATSSHWDRHPGVCA